MKKLLAIFAVLSLAFLASCGGNTEDKGDKNKGGETKKEETTSKSSCDTYLAYMECTSKKAGMDEATIKSTLDQTKSAWKAMDSAQMEETCKQVIEAAKKQPAVEGCSL